LSIQENQVITEEQTSEASNVAALRSVIEGRRTVGKFHPEQPPRELIEQVLEAATWAPNHRLTEPWRFVVLAGAAREELGRFMGEQNAAKYPDDETRREFERAKGERKALRAPVVIALGVEPVQASNVEEIEEIAAVAAAAQNMLLTAHTLGLGAKWSSGAIIHDAGVKSWLGLSERALLLGFLYIGYPAMAPSQRSLRTPAAELTDWRDWDDSRTAPPPGNVDIENR
jgi:nitroreductase